MSEKKQSAPEPHDKTDLFEYETDAGTIRIPYLENLPVGVIEDAAGKNADEFLKIAFDMLMDDEAVTARRSLTLREYNDFVAKWNDQSAIHMGEFFA